MNVRRKRHQRQVDPPPVRLTERDLRLLEAVYQYRVLSQEQLQRLIFTAKHPSIAQARLRLLYDHAYLQRRFLPSVGGLAASPVLYLLDQRGSQQLVKQGYDDIRWLASDNKVGYEHLEHLLAINTFRIEVTLACDQQPDYGLLHWLDDTTLKQDYDRVSVPSLRQPVAVIPDGYFCLQTPTGITYFFLELDRGTMSSKRFKQKIMAYLAYQQSGKLHQRFKTHKFRVLTVTESQTRAENLKTATESIQGANRFWFACLGDLRAETVLDQPVWMIAQRTGCWSLLQ